MISNPQDVSACLKRVLALMTERDTINRDIAQVLDEYKPKGVIPKGIRKVAALQRMDATKRKNDEQLYSDYEDALGSMPEAAAIVAAGGTYEQAAEATGYSRATVARIVAAAKVSNGPKNETPHGPVTGECLSGRVPRSDEQETDSRAAGGDEGRQQTGEPLGGVDPASRQPEPNAGAAGGADAPAPIARPFKAKAGEGDEAVATHCRPSPPYAEQVPPTVELGAVAEPQAERVAPEIIDDLAFPAHLRRVRV